MIICISDMSTVVLETGEPDFYVDADVFTSLLKDREKADRICSVQYGHFQPLHISRRSKQFRFLSHVSSQYNRRCSGSYCVPGVWWNNDAACLCPVHSSNSRWPPAPARPEWPSGRDLR